MFRADPQAKDGPRINKEIRVQKVQLITFDGDNMGEVNTSEALRMAEEAGLDLMEISPHATPPVCKILDLGKLKYSNKKKAAEARKKQKIIEVKEIKLRPNISINDYRQKVDAMSSFIKSGHKVKVTLKFRGREISHHDLGMKLFEKISDEVCSGTGVAKIELPPKLEGRQIVMVLASK